MPIIVAPMSQQRMANDEGELAVARAAAKEGTVMVSSCTMSPDIGKIVLIIAAYISLCSNVLNI